MSVSCEDFEDAVSDLAVEGVAEPQRSALLAHADECASCEAALAAVVQVADALLAAGPRMEPPAGFESRALARMGPPRPSWARRAAVAAAVVIAVVAGAVVARSGSDSGQQTAAGLIIATSGQRMGKAELEAGASTRIVLTMDGESRWGGRWTCQLLDDGQWVEVASWTADEVHGGVWAAGVPEALADAAEMRILGDDGRVIATAKLS